MLCRDADAAPALLVIQLNGTTEMWSSPDFKLPDGAADYYLLGKLGEAEAVNSGLLLMDDGRVLLREAGQEDENLSESFASLPATTFRYAPLSSEGATDEDASGTALAQCSFPCEVNGKLCEVTLTRLRDKDGAIGYAVQCEGWDGVGLLCDPQQFNAGCAIDYVLGFEGGKSRVRNKAVH